MVEITANNTKKGKAIEHHIISELLKNDFEIYKPIVDSGTDLVIKDNSGGLVDIQIKSRTIKKDDDYFSIKSFEPRENFFIICHNISEDIFFVMASSLFHKHSKIYKEKGREFRHLPYTELKKRLYYSDEAGLNLLKKALTNPNNRVKLFLDEEQQLKQNL